VINEFMYRPRSRDAGVEWIELHNRGSRSVDLQGWKFSRGVKFTFPDISIAAGGYLVVAAERAKFVAVHPRVAHVVGGWRGRLANTDEIELRAADGLRVDRVRYADQGDWGIRVRALQDGWDWECPADGGGKTMELMNSALPNRRGQNWTFSRTVGGSPGRVNAAATSDVSPMIYRAMHSPAVPRSTDVVTITTEIVDERLNACDVTLHLRNTTAQSASRFSEQPMFDDGLHDDGAAGDGVFGAQIPPLPAAAIIEYFISADDGRTRPRTWPAPARLEDGSPAQVVNAVFQIDDAVYLGTQPMIRLVMCPEEREHLDSDRFDDSLSHGTLISTDAEGTKVRYNVGIRVRGFASRREDPHNVRVQIPADRRWNGLSAFNLNTQFPYAQLMGSALCQNSGLPAANVRAVQVRLNGINEARCTQPQFGSYALLEVINAEWAANHFPLDDDGNVYGARRGNTDLRYYGAKPAEYHGFTKRSNSRQNDWDDLIIMTYVLEHSSHSKYLQHVGSVVNIDEWVNYFAVLALLGHGETSPFNGEADDYDLYRGIRDTRFILLPHDLDTLLGEGDFCRKPFDHGLYNMEQLEVFETFITHPIIRAKYHARLHELMETSFSPARFDPLIDDLLGAWVPSDVIERMKQFVVKRNRFVRSVIIPHPAMRLNMLRNRPASLPVVNHSATDAAQSDSVSRQSNEATDGRSLSPIIINEVLAWNQSVAEHAGRFPVMIEIRNSGDRHVNLKGLRLSNDPRKPDKYVFPDTPLAAGGFLVVFANQDDSNAGPQPGFSLNRNGDALYLFDKPESGGHQLDSVTFGPQLPNRSIGRIPGTGWGLTNPTPGTSNVAQPVADGSQLVINEWLAAPVDSSDFIEIHNPHELPVNLGGMSLTDKPLGHQNKSPVTPLSFVDAEGHFVFIADSRNRPGHVDFRLCSDQGQIALFHHNGSLIDSVYYGPQRVGISQGHSGSQSRLYFETPTPGQANPMHTPAATVSLIPWNHEWCYDTSGVGDLRSWKLLDANDSDWTRSSGLFATAGVSLPHPIGTQLDPPNDRVSLYFRTSFQFDITLDVAKIELTHLVRDGAVFYLNGKELFRHGMPDDAVLPSTLADADGEPQLLAATIPRSRLLHGDNLLAVELHRGSRNNADLVLGVALDLTLHPRLAAPIAAEAPRDPVPSAKKTPTNTAATVASALGRIRSGGRAFWTGVCCLLAIGIAAIHTRVHRNQRRPR